MGVTKMIVTMSRSTRKPPRKSGDVRTWKGMKQVCQQVYTSDGAGRVSHGRPVLEWVPVEESRVEQALKQMRARQEKPCSGA